MKRTIIALVGLWTAIVGCCAFGNTNSWLGGDGDWQTQTDWSLNQLPNSGQDVVITNVGTFTVMIDDQTASNFPTAMTVSSVSASNIAGVSTLLLTNTPSSTIPILFSVSNNIVIGARSILELIDASASGAGVSLHGAKLVADATVLMSNAALQVGEVDVGISPGGHGIWQMSGASNMVSASNLQVGGSGGQTGEVVVADGVFTVLNFFTIDAGGVFTVSNGVVNANGIGLGGAGSNASMVVSGGTLTLSGSMALGGSFQATVWQTGGTLSVMNPSTSIDFGNGNGSQLICSGGVLMAQRLIVGEHGSGQSWILAGGTSTVQQVEIESGSLSVSGGRLVTAFLSLDDTFGDIGTVTLSAGQVQVTSQLNIGAASQSKSLVNISGGTLTIASTSLPGSEAPAHIGAGGAGDVEVSGGTFRANTIWVGASSGSAGTLTVSGGLVDTATGSFGMNLLIGEVVNSTGVVIFTSGTLHTLTITVGDAGWGSLAISSNADFEPLTVSVGNQSGAVGSLNIEGGSVFSLPLRRVQTMQIGVSAGSTGRVWVTNGSLFVGNPQSCAQGGIFVGKLGYGRLSATNAVLDLAGLSIGPKGIFECVNSQFIPFGGCTMVNSNVISFVNSSGSLSAGMQNVGTITISGGTITFSQLVNNSGTIVATNGVVQFSGGISNTGSVLVGPDKFCITAIVPTGNDVSISWPALGGNRYRIQAGASVTGTFFDITSDIVPPGSGFITTNYVDVGGLTNSANRFYRVRQIY